MMPVRSRLAKWLLGFVAGRREADEMVGELDQEFQAFIRPERGALRAAMWYGGQVLRSLASARSHRPARMSADDGAGLGESIVMDVRFAVRGLVKSPGFAAVAIVTLGLGIGANAAIFTVVNTVLIRPLPYDRPEELVRVWPGGNFESEIVTFFNARAKTLSGVAAFNDWRFTLTGAGEPTELPGAVVSTNHFDLLGRVPQLGRTFVSDDAEQGAEPVVILSHAVWQTYFGGDRSVIGRTIQMARDDVGRRTVVGIMPADYVPLGYRVRVDVWVPLPIVTQGTSRATDLFVTSRLAPGVTIEQASAEVRQLAQTSLEAFPGSNRQRNVDRADVVSLQAAFVGSEDRNTLQVLLAGVALVVLIASANVANLLLVRAGAREREVAMRMALGANRWRVAQQLLTESVVLGLAGGATGLVGAVAALSAVSRILPSFIPRASEVSIDLTVFLFTLGVSLMASVLAGLTPALRAGKLDVDSALRHGVRTTSGVSRYRLNRALLTLELAVSMVLVVGAGLTLKSLWRMGQVDLGLETDNVMTMRVAPPAAVYETPVSRGQFYDLVRARVAAVPGAAEVSVIQNIPMAIGRASRVRFVPEGGVADPEGAYVAALRLTKGDHFQTFGIPLMRGRRLVAGDATSVELAIVIDESLARETWPEGEALGKTLRILGDALTLRVVGVVGSVLSSLDGRAESMIYMDLDQWNAVALPRLADASTRDDVVAWSEAQSLSAYVNFWTTGSVTQTVQATRAAVWSVHENAAIVDVRTMMKVASDGVSTPRFLAWLMTLFGALALSLGAIGVYGLLSYLVSKRTHEIGVHMALGAQKRSVVRTVLAQGLGPVAIGLVLGIVGALLASRVLASQLFGVEPFDPVTYGTVVAVLLVTALVAAILPARRAAGVDPIVALRAD